jgi:hypothetical protein
MFEEVWVVVWWETGVKEEKRKDNEGEMTTESRRRKRR